MIARIFGALLLWGAVLLHPQLAHATHPDTPLSAQQGRQMVQDLKDLTQDNWARVAGADTGLSPHINGHDEFAALWTQKIRAALHGLHAGVTYQSFSVPGFAQAPASRPGVNVVVTISGTRQANQSVVIGAHYDGEPFSHGSAYDDASGCVIMLGLARTLGNLWRSRGLPSRTVQFVLFDAEEQGLIGSDVYAFYLRHAALLPRPALMINEEQNGVGYPVRPFGQRSQAPLDTHAVTVSRVPPPIHRLFEPFAPLNRSALAQEGRRLAAARSTVFTQLHGVYESIPFTQGSAPVFARADMDHLLVGRMDLCCSDDLPFQAMGVPTLTLAGNSDYYSRSAPDWAFPFDQPEDTLSSLACDTGGIPVPGAGLAAALNLSMAVSLQMVLDYAPSSRGHDFAILSSVPAAHVFTQFQAVTPESVTWNFGDGAQGSGAHVRHRYGSPGHYHVTVKAGNVSHAVDVVVPAHAPLFTYHFKAGQPPRRPWHPVGLQGVTGCQ